MTPTTLGMWDVRPAVSRAPGATEDIVMIIVLGTAQDEHVSTVADELKNLSVNCVIADYLARTPVRTEVDGIGSFSFWIDGQTVTGPILLWDRLEDRL